MSADLLHVTFTYHSANPPRDYDNFLRTEPPVSFGYYQKYVTQPEYAILSHVPLNMLSFQPSPFPNPHFTF